MRDDAGVPADVLVNGVVRYNTKGIRTMSVGEWREQIGVMLDAAFVCTKHLTDGLISAGRPGSVVNLISTVGHQGEPGNVGYCTAKGGLLNFTRSVAMELAPYGIRVNSLTPTATDPAQAQERARRWGVPGVPEDVLPRAGGRRRAGSAPAPARSRGLRPRGGFPRLRCRVGDHRHRLTGRRGLARPLLAAAPRRGSAGGCPLMRGANLIGGTWRLPVDGRHIEVVDPATREEPFDRWYLTIEPIVAARTQEQAVRARIRVVRLSRGLF